MRGVCFIYVCIYMGTFFINEAIEKCIYYRCREQWIKRAGKEKDTDGW